MSHPSIKYILLKKQFLVNFKILLFTFRIKRIVRAFVLLLVHPLVLLLLFVSFDTYLNFKDMEVDVLVKKSISATKRALMYSVVDAHVYGNWVFSLGALCLMPIWLILWFIVWHPVNNSKLKTDVKSKKT